MKKFNYRSPSKSLYFALSTLFFLSLNLQLAAQFGSPTVITAVCRQYDFKVADFDMDGDLDAIMVLSPNVEARRLVVLYENVNGVGTEWVPHEFDAHLDFSLVNDLVVEDFNNDGWMDFVLCGSDNDGMTYYQNAAILGVIHFTKNVMAASNLFSNLEAGDLNGDGFLDLVANLNSNLITTFFDGGNADFLPSNYLVTFGFDKPRFMDLRLTDLDGDNDLDILASRLQGDPNYYTSDIVWYENVDGLGNFGEEIMIDFLDTFAIQQKYFQYVNVGDFNGDGLEDLLIFQDSLKIKYKLANGTFLAAVPFSNDFTIDKLDEFILIDFDEDGDLDVVHPGNVNGSMRWYRNADGLGTFEEVLVGSTDLSDDHTIGNIGDADGDGDLDFFFQNNQNGMHGLHLLFNDGTNENFIDEVKISDNIVGPYQVISTDVDMDGDEDLMYIGRITGHLYWSENLDGNGALSKPNLLFEDDGIEYFTIGDFDDDGDDDVLVSWKKNAPAEVYIYEKLNDTPEYAPKKVLLESGSTYPVLKVTDWDNDGDQDIVLEQNNSIFWLQNSGNLDFIQQPQLVYGDLVDVCNFDNDAFPDLLYEGFGGDAKMYLHTSVSDGAEVLIGSQTYYKELFAADIENDGDDDVVIWGRGDNFQKQIRILYNDNGDFSEYILADNVFALSQQEDLTVADLDADGKQDICMRNKWYRQLDSPIDFAPIDITFQNGGSDFPPIALAKLTDDALPDLIFDQIDDVMFWRKNNISDGFLVGGSVFFDQDEDCLYTPNPDTALYGWIVKMEDVDDNNFYLNTSPLGSYGGFLPDSGDYIFNVLRPSAYWGRCVEDTVLTVSPTSNFGTIDFPVQVDVACPLMGLQIISGRLRPCIAGSITVKYCNYGTIPAENVQVIAQLEESLLVDNISPPFSSSTDSTYTFDLQNVGVGECGYLSFFVTPDCQSVDVGDQVCLTATITPDDICLPLDSLWDGSSIIATGNCVNDTTVFQLKNVGTGDMTTPQQYRVEFIVNDDIVMLMQVDTFQLGVNEIKEIKVPTEAQAMRIEADQNMFHPLVDNASAMVLNCITPPPPAQSFTLINSFPDQDGNPFSETLCITLSGSYDPNTKECFPLGIEGRYIENDWELEYFIHFQNTGNDTAFVVKIRDKISENLDLSTLRVGASSHPYIWDLDINRTLTFTFDDILLPDSLTNELGSQGHVQFFIKPVPGLPVLTDIDNRAFIYFDFNLPIETNTVRRTIRKPVTADSEHFELCAGEFFDNQPIFSDTIVIDTLVDNWSGCYLFFNNITAFQTTFVVDTLVGLGDLFDGQIIEQDTAFIYEDEDVNGCLTTTYVNIFLLNSSNELEPNDELQLFPNPATETVFIYYQNQPITNTAVEIFHINGQKMNTKRTQDHLLWIGDLPKGMYFLKIAVGGEWFFRKLKVEN